MRGAENFRHALLASAAGFALLGTGCMTRGGKPASPAAADATRALYDRSCSACHGLQGEGKQLGTLRVPTLRVGAAAAADDERLFTQISNGGNGMPPFKYTLDDRQIQDLVRFVRREIQGKR